MITLDQLKKTLDDTLGLGGRTSSWTPDTHLLGAVPELDSLAVVNVISSLEQTFGIMIDDDDINASNFETLGTLYALITNTDLSTFKTA